MINPMQIMQMLPQFRQNPMAMLGQRFNIPNGIQSPQDMVQHLLNSGQVSQAQVNSAMMQMRSIPQFKNMF